jgi:lipoprotein-anchoring transpeptidase ErfK/SrfK
MLPEGELPYPVAWTLVNLYPSKEPGGEPRESNGMHYRYTLVYLYDTVEVDGYNWYQVGEDKWVHQFNVAQISPVDKPADVDTERWISVDLYEQTLVAYQGDQPIFATLVATGLDRWATHEGVFNIYYRKTRKHMSGGIVGDDYYFLEEVPWTMFFDEGIALHGTYWHDAFGYQRSHGCVNLSITDAYWLYQWVAETFDGKLNSADIEVGPAVYVFTSEKYE